MEAYDLTLSLQRTGFAGILLGLALLLAIFTLKSPALSGPLLVAISGLAIFDLMALNRGLIRTASPAVLRYRPPVVQALRNEGFQRVHVNPFELVGERSERHLELPPIRTDVAKDPATLAVAKALAIMDLLFPNVAGRFDIEASYDRDALGLYPHEMSLLVESMWSSYDTPAYVRFLQLGAVDKVVSAQYLPGLIPLADYPSLYPEPVHLLGVPNPLPRCYAVSGVRIADGLDAVHILTDPSFEPRREVIFPSGRGIPASAGFEGSCHIEGFRPDELGLEATLSGSGYVVVVDAYDPGWRVSVDGSRATLLRANTTFRAVALGAGVHRVQFLYRPRAIQAGILLSIAAFSLLALVWWREGSQKSAESR
jgi:hypothetical protein